MDPLAHLFVQSLVRQGNSASPPPKTRQRAWRRLIALAVRQVRRNPLPTGQPVAD